MKELVFATNNKNKVAEIQLMLSNHYALKDLQSIGCDVDIPENEKTLAGNALAKARFVKTNFGLDCFADDTGLEVEALNGEPGVYSARYAGNDKNSNHNMNKLLEKLAGKSNRKAHFKTVIALIIGDDEYLFEGIAEGEITYKKEGEHGFGYDPIFRPSGHSKTFAQMPMEEKGPTSHRGKAVAKLVAFLHSTNLKTK